MLLDQTIKKLVDIAESLNRGIETLGKSLDLLKELFTMRCDRADSGIQNLGSRLDELENKVRALEGRQT